VARVMGRGRFLSRVEMTNRWELIRQRVLFGLLRPQVLVEGLQLEPQLSCHVTLELPGTFLTAEIILLPTNFFP